MIRSDSSLLTIETHALAWVELLAADRTFRHIALHHILDALITAVDVVAGHKNHLACLVLTNDAECTGLCELGRQTTQALQSLVDSINLALHVSDFAPISVCSVVIDQHSSGEK